MHFKYLLSLSLAIVFACSLHARERGILNQKAGTWGVSQWHNLPEGQSTLDVSDYKGKVIYLYCFQSWCPGCHRYGFPTLQTLIEHYQNNDAIVFVAVQTTFEGHGTNTFDKAVETAKRYELTIPVGQSGNSEELSILMANYRTGGTPWTVIIDKDGLVRYNHFHIKPEKAQALIDSLL